MLRKRKAKLREDFRTIFQGLSDEDKVELGSSLMFEMYILYPHKLEKVMMDMKIAQLARRTEELLRQNEESIDVLKKLRENS